MLRIAEMDEMLAGLEAEERREARVIEKLHLYREKDMNKLERAIPHSKLFIILYMILYICF